MKVKIKLNIVDAVWRSIKHELRNCKERVGNFLSSLCFWQHETFVAYKNSTHPTTIHFRGRAESFAALRNLLGTAYQDNEQTKSLEHLNAVYIDTFPSFNAICIPLYLTTLVNLEKPIEDILADYSRSLRRSITKQLPKFKYEVVTEASKVEFINDTMLRPYAIARHDLSAHHLDADVVKNLALGRFGRLDTLYEDDKPVACHLGNAYVRRGASCWHVNRFGYIKEVFSDNRYLNEVNSINLHMALLTAIDSGYDYCDYGMSPATPGRGPIEWKRRRKGFLSRVGSEHFYLKPPKVGAAQFFWDTPIFAIEGRKIVLYLGLPANKTIDEINEQYIAMGYKGLSKVYLKCDVQPIDEVIQVIQNLFAKQVDQPHVIVNIAK